MAASEKDEYEVLRPYFTTRGWLELSNYEKLRFHNMKQNYEMMVEIGLDVPPPEFMRPKKNTAKKRQRDTSEEENGDEEWLPFKKPSTHSVKTSARLLSAKRNEAASTVNSQKGAGDIPGTSSSTEEKSSVMKVKRGPKQSSNPTKRSYPKRRQPHKCYKEEVVPDDDHYIYCEDCGEFNDASCPKHPLTVIEDLPLAPRCRSKARKSLPSGLAIHETTIVGAGFGVFAEQPFQKGVQFGPYKGETVDGAEAYNSGYAWEICADGKAIHYIDAKNESKSNWMRYVNCARNENEQNLVAFQYFGQIYYRSFKPIPPGAELLVYYGKDYAHDLGIQKVFSSDSKRGTVTQGGSSFECEECGRLFTIHIYLLKHLKYSHRHAIYFPRAPVDRPNRGIMSTQGAQYFIASTELSTLAHHGQMNGSQPGDSGADPCQAACCEDTPTKQSLSEDKHSGSGSSVDHPGSADGGCTPRVDHQATGVADMKEDSTPQCGTYGGSSTQSSNLRGPGLIHSSEKQHQCEICGRCCTTGGNLRKHELIHSGVKPHQCGTCGKSFTQAGSLRKHELIHSGVKPHQCGTCGKSFTQAGSLRKHGLIHSGVKPHQCKTCGKSFTQTGNLRLHELIHSGVKPHQCKTCGKSFTVAFNLRRHELIHSGVKPHQCKTCGKSSTQASDLRKHELIHSGVKPHQCETCGKAFTQAGSLRKHELIHSGVKPHQCKTCGKSFTRSSNLRGHELIHSGVKPHRCKTCGQSFADACNLRQHVQIHFIGEHRKCRICSESFVTSSLLEAHERRHSNEQ